jgi:hypothetical protein
VNKIEWEGGYSGILEYGVTAADMPDIIYASDEELVSAWRELDAAWVVFTKATERLNEILGIDSAEGET